MELGFTLFSIDAMIAMPAFVSDDNVVNLINAKIQKVKRWFTSKPFLGRTDSNPIWKHFRLEEMNQWDNPDNDTSAVVLTSKNLYEVLGVPKDATESQIKRAYHKLAM